MSVTCTNLIRNPALSRSTMRKSLSEDGDDDDDDDDDECQLLLIGFVVRTASFCALA